MSVPAGIRRHLVGKTSRNVCHRDIAEIRFVGKLMIIWTFSENQIIRLYWNNMINLCPLTALLHRIHIHAAPSSVLPWTAQSRLVPSTFKIAAAKNW